MIIECAINLLFLYHELFYCSGQAEGHRNINPSIVDENAYYYFEIDARYCDDGDLPNISAEFFRYI